MIIFKTLTIINKPCYLTNRGWVRRSGPLMLSCIFTTCYCKCFTMSQHYNNESTLSEHFFVFATCANSFLETISRILSFSKRHTSNQIVFLKTSPSRKKKIYFRARKFRSYKAFDGRWYSGRWNYPNLCLHSLFPPRHWTDLGLGLVSVWVCEGGPSSPWEQPGWARHYCLHGACSHLALDGALRETQAGANLQKTLPACLIMRMTCSSIPPLRVRAATMFPWSCDTFAGITWTTYCVASVHSYYCAVQFWVWKWYNEMFQRISKTTGCVIFR